MGVDVDDGSCVELTTAPTSAPTHWAHTTVLLDRPLAAGSALTVRLDQSKRSHHDLNLTLGYDAESGKRVQASYAITADFRSQERIGYGDGGFGEDNMEDDTD